MSDKAKKTIIRISIGLLIFFVIFFFGVRIFFRAPYGDFYKNAKKVFYIPDSNYGFVSQGMTYDEGSDLFFLCGYMTNHMGSVIYTVDEKDKDNIGLSRMKMENGADNLTHAGGIAIWKDNVYIAGCDDKKIYVYGRDDILNSGWGEPLMPKGIIDTDTEGDGFIVPDSVFVLDDKLYVTEFYREENYKTDPSHAYTTEAGNENNALIIVYDLSEEYDLGVSSVPAYAYSIPDLVQGIFIDKDMIYMSASYGMAASHIYAYPFDIPKEDDVKVLSGSEVKIKAYDINDAVLDIKAPPMAEEIVIKDGMLYINCESAANKWVFGKFTSAYYLYALNLDSYTAKE